MVRLLCFVGVPEQLCLARWVEDGIGHDEEE